MKSIKPLQKFSRKEYYYKDTKLSRWVYEIGGPVVLAKTICVSPGCVRNWLQQKFSPSAANIEAIRLVSGNKLSSSQILKDTLPCQKN